jgi:hypothetical protein
MSNKNSMKRTIKTEPKYIKSRQLRKNEFTNRPILIKNVVNPQQNIEEKKNEEDKKIVNFNEKINFNNFCIEKKESDYILTKDGKEYKILLVPLEKKKINLLKNLEIIRSIDSLINNEIIISNGTISIFDNIESNIIKTNDKFHGLLFYLNRGDKLKLKIINNLDLTLIDEFKEFEYLEFNKNKWSTINDLDNMFTMHFRGLQLENNNLFKFIEKEMTYELNIPKDHNGGFYSIHPLIFSETSNYLSLGFSNYIFITNDYYNKFNNIFLTFDNISSVTNDNDDMNLFLLNGQIQPIIELDFLKNNMVHYINSSGNTITRITIDNHYILVIAKDGHIMNKNAQISNISYDPDFVYTPNGVFLNYLIVSPGQRFSFIIIPKTEILINTQFNLLIKPIDYNELFFQNNKTVFNNKNELIPSTKMNTNDIILGKITYTNNINKTDIKNIISLAFETNLKNDINHKNKSYLFINEYPNFENWKQSFNIRKISNINGRVLIELDDMGLEPKIGLNKDLYITISGTENYDGQYSVLEYYDGYKIIINRDFIVEEKKGLLSHNFFNIETHNINIKSVNKNKDIVKITCFEPHRLVKGNSIYAVSDNNDTFIINNLIDDYTIEIKTDKDILTTSIIYETINLYSEYFYYYNIPIPKNLTDKIINRRKIIFSAFDENNINGLDDKYKIISYNGLTEEWLMINKSKFIDIFHIGNLNYQICGYRDYNFQFNKSIISNPFTDFKNYNYLEIAIPFYGYEDTTIIPAGQDNLNEYGEVRIRINFNKKIGKTLIDSTLYSNSTNNIKIIEII